MHARFLPRLISFLLLSSPAWAGEFRLYVPPPLHLPTDTKRVVVVKKGDTLSGLARQHRTTVKALRQVNALKSDIIHPGQSLKLPPP